MTAVLDDLEYVAWHMAAEPTQERMDALLELIVRRAPELAVLAENRDDPEIPRDALNVVPNVVPVKVSESPEIPSEGHLDVPQGPVPVPTSETYRVSHYPVTGELQGKTCNTCHLFLPYDRYNKDQSVKKDGRRGKCKDCEAKARRERRRRQGM